MTGLVEGRGNLDPGVGETESSFPLVVDLDGSLLRSDTLQELFAASLRRPAVLLAGGWELISRGRAALKEFLSSELVLDFALLPLNESVRDYVARESETGRQVILATGADSRIAQEIVRLNPQFSGYLASDGVRNLTGEEKARALVEKFGLKQFDYVGNSTQDRAVWSVARHAILVSSSKATPRWARGVAFAETLRDHRPGRWMVWSRQLRVHQSLKNLLLFIPALAGHSLTLQNLFLLVGGFLAFTLMAFSVYLLNDLLDVASDRSHSSKSRRPIASGVIRPLDALLVAIVLCCTSLLVGFAISAVFGLVLLLYAAMTWLYSAWLKRIALVDVIMLALLYMVRILAGSALVGIALSFWLTGFTLFLFVSLAFVKRYTEFRARQLADGSDLVMPGRGYISSDETVVLTFGTGAGMGAVLLMASYIQSEDVSALYPSTGVLWLILPAMLFWVFNVWLKAARGDMHDDPIVFALKDRASLVSGALMVSLAAVAASPALAI